MFSFIFFLCWSGLSENFVGHRGISSDIETHLGRHPSLYWWRILPKTLQTRSNSPALHLLSSASLKVAVHNNHVRMSASLDENLNKWLKIRNDLSTYSGTFLRLTRRVRLVSDADFFVTSQVKRGFQTMKKK